MILKVKYVLLILVYYCSFEIFCKNLPKTMKLLPGSVCSVATESTKPSQLAQNNCNLLWQILVALTKLLVGKNWHDPKWSIQIENICAPIGTLQWALNIRNIQTFGWMTFETYLGWWNEFRRSDCFKIFAVSLIWRRPKVPYQTYLRDCVFHLKWLQARPLPTCFDTVLMVQNA